MSIKDVTTIHINYYLEEKTSDRACSVKGKITDTRRNVSVLLIIKSKWVIQTNAAEVQRQPGTEPERMSLA